jgi:hypothetical protein
MSIRVLQKREQWIANIMEAERRLLPAVLADDGSIGVTVSDWLGRNCVDEHGFVDGSVENVLLAVKTLDKAKMLSWAVAPKKKIRVDAQHSGPGGLKNHASKNLTVDQSFGNDVTSRTSSVQEVVAQQNAERALASVRARIDQYSSGRNHARTAEHRASLRRIYDAAVTAKKSPEETMRLVDAAMRKLP